MNKKKIILTDIDGVVLDWEFAFHGWMEHRGYLPNKDVKDHYNIGVGFGLDNAEALCRQFNESAAIGFLPPLRDAQYYIRLLHEKHQYRFIAVTSLSEDPHACKLRERNLVKLFGPNTFMEFHFLDTAADKEGVLSELAKKYSGCCWLEDKIENAIVGKKLGFRSLLMEHRFNMQDYFDSGQTNSAIPLLKNWEEFYYLLTGDFGD